jgi:hypothetical protein
MHYLNLFLTLVGLLTMCVSAAPILNNDNNLPISDTKGPEMTMM